VWAGTFPARVPLIIRVMAASQCLRWLHCELFPLVIQINPNGEKLRSEQAHHSRIPGAAWQMTGTATARFAPFFRSLAGFLHTLVVAD
jgi:hypothetical protein